MSRSFPLIVKCKCEECNKQRIFRLGRIPLISPIRSLFYVCTKCGYWQDARSFLREKRCTK